MNDARKTSQENKKKSTSTSASVRCCSFDLQRADAFNPNRARSSREYCPILGNLVDLFFGFSKFQTLSELVRSCSNADFCVQGVICQRFSSFTFSL